MYNNHFLILMYEVIINQFLIIKILNKIIIFLLLIKKKRNLKNYVINKKFVILKIKCL